MKKKVLVVLMLALCLALSACGKSEAVKNVEAQIDALGEVSAESGEALSAAEKAYAALTDAEKEKVANFETLSAAKDRFTELKLVGDWFDGYVNFWDLNEEAEKVDLTLKADGTARSYDMDGTWSVSEGKIVSTWGDMIIHEENGTTYLTYDNGQSDDNRFIPAQAHQDWLDKTFLVIDLAETDPSEVFDIYIQEVEEINEWDEPTGFRSTCAFLGSKLYDQGWYNYQGDGEIAVELLIPEYTQKWKSGGYTGKEKKESSAGTANGFGYPVAYIDYYDEKNDYSTTSDLTADQISFGRAKGKLYFINKDYVKQATWKDQYTRILETYDSLNPEVYTLGAKQYWNEEHPY